MTSNADGALVDGASFKAAMRCLPGAVSIVTAGSEGARRGLTVTAVCSLSAEPPCLIACINRSAEAHPVIQETGRFAINILNEKHADLAELFAGRGGIKGAIRFDSGRWSSVETEAPVLADAAAWFDCMVDRAISAATHTIFIGLVARSSFSPAANPLLYLGGAFGVMEAGNSRGPHVASRPTPG